MTTRGKSDLEKKKRSVKRETVYNVYKITSQYKPTSLAQSNIFPFDMIPLVYVFQDTQILLYTHQV